MIYHCCQNKLARAFKIGIRPQTGLRLQAEVSVERIAGSEQNRDLLPTRYTLFATRYNLILQPMAFSLIMPIPYFILDRCDDLLYNSEDSYFLPGKEKQKCPLLFLKKDFQN